MRQKVINEHKQSKKILLNSTIPKSYNLYNINFTFFCPIYTFPWRETKLFTRQIKVQMGKSNLIILFIEEKMPTLAGNKHPSVQFFFTVRVFSIF